METVDRLIDGAAFEQVMKKTADAERARSYPTPIVNSAELLLNNRLSCRRSPIAITLGDAVIGFKPIGLNSLDRLARPDARMLFWFTIDGRPAVLQMAAELYQRIMARIDPELLAADIDQELLPLLLESCVEDTLTQAEAELGHRLELAAVQPGAAFNLTGLDIALEISIDGKKSGFAALRAAKDDVIRLAQILSATSKPPRSYGDLQIELSLRAGAIWLNLGALQVLKPGDVLLAQDDASRFQRLAATAGEQWLFPIELTRKGPTARGAFRRADRNDQEEWMMANLNKADANDEAPSRTAPDIQEPSAGPPTGDATNDLSEDDVARGVISPPADTAYDDLPIKLVFELGRIEVPLGKLQEIGQGHVFELERPIGEAVEIHASGRRIGQGEVVRIDDQIGVRVVRLFGQSGA
ncbi:MAG: type III secretion system cytoplasmic ring protein SctQ [Pseudomonadota bacterium]